MIDKKCRNKRVEMLCFGIFCLILAIYISDKYLYIVKIFAYNLVGGEINGRYN